MDTSFTQQYLADALASFRAYRKLAEKALAQLSDEQYFITLDPESNSIAVIMKHIAGNMVSRWTDFLTSDGEKPDRNRDAEFVIDPQTTKADLFAYWERGWTCLFNALEPLQPEDFDKRITIRGQEHSIVQAINRQMTHYALHIGQMVFLAKHFRSSQWQSLSVPRNRSAEFTSYLKTTAGPADKEQQLEAVMEFASKSENAGEANRVKIMSLEIIELHHVNITVPQAQEAATKHFYGVILGLPQLQKPVGSRVDVGAWYQLGAIQLHLSIEDEVDNQASDRHVCYVVRDVAQAAQHFRAADVVVIPDPRPIPGRPRIYVRDPGGNLLEIAQQLVTGIQDR